MTPEEIAALPEKVLREHYTCDAGNGHPDSCRQRGRVYVDGVAYCAEHTRLIEPFLQPLARRIRYEVAR